MRRLRHEQNSPEHIAAISRGLKAARARMMAGDGFIYVAELVGTDAIKIGFSLEPARRMLSFGGRLRLLGYFPCSLKREKAFHRAHVALRHPSFDGEYYRRADFRDDLVSERTAQCVTAALAPLKAAA